MNTPFKKARFCLWRNEAGKDKVPYQINGKRTRANNINSFTDFKRALAHVDKFDGLGIGIFNEISAIDIDNCIKEDGSYSDLAKYIMWVRNFIKIYFTEDIRGI